MTDAHAETDVWPNPPRLTHPLPEGVSDTFASPCLACGQLTHIIGGVEQPHEHVAHTSWHSLVATAWWGGHDYALTRQEPARPATESAPDASRVLGDAPTATDAREARYDRGRDPIEERDATIAALRAEVERLKRGGAELGRILERTLTDALNASGRHDAIEEDGDGDWGVVWETLAELRPRAEKAEAEVERLRLRHHEQCFQRRPEGIPADLPDDICDCRILWMLKGATAAQDRADVAEAALAEFRQTVGRFIPPHGPSATEHGPDYCKACSDAICEWVTWPCPLAETMGWVVRAALASAAPAVSDGEDATSEAPIITEAVWHAWHGDNEPCTACGGDRLRPDFTDAPRCHAPASPVVAPSATEAPQAPAEQEGLACRHGRRLGPDDHGCARCREENLTLALDEQHMHGFEEDVDDGSMCVCGVPATEHWRVEPHIQAAIRDCRLAPSVRPATADDEGVRRG